MQSNIRKKFEQLVILAAIIGAIAVSSGCQSVMTTINLPSGSYIAYPFTYSKGDRLEVTVNSTGEPLNVIILHGGNFTRYTQGEEYFAEEYHKGVISTRCDFLVPQDGEYYLILENRGPAAVKGSFSYTSHATTRYESSPIEGTLKSMQKEPQLIPSSVVQTTLTTIVPFQTTQPGPIATQTLQPQKAMTSEAQMLYERGVLLAEQGDLTGALTLFDQALQLDPENITIWYMKGALHFDLGQYQEALIASERTTTLDPNDADTWYNKGLDLYYLERYAESLVAAERALTLNPNDADTWALKADALFVLDRDEEALVAAERALTLNPNHPKAWTVKAGALVYLGRDEEALTAAEVAIAANPSSSRAWKFKAIALTDLERYEEALTAAKVVTTTYPNDAIAWNVEGWIEYSLGRYADAVASFDRALELDPDYEQAKVNKAKALEKLGS